MSPMATAVAKLFVACPFMLIASGCGGDASQTESGEQTVVESLESSETVSPSEASESTTLLEPAASGESQTAIPAESNPIDELPSDPFELIDRAISSLEAGDGEAAFKIALHAKRLAPEDPDVLFTYARALAARSRLFEAVRVLDRLAESHPETRLFAIGQTAEWLVEMGDAEAAEKRYRELRREVDDASQSFVDHQLVMMFMRQGERFKAAEVIRELCKTGDVNLSELILLLKVGIPLPESEKLFGEFEPVTDLGIVMQSISRGDWQEALQKLERPNASDQVLAMRGRVYAEQNQSNALREWIEAEYANVADRNDAKFAWAIHQLANQQGAQAAKVLSEVLLRDPTNVAAYEGLADALVLLDQTESASAAKMRAGQIQQSQQIGAQFASGSADAVSIQKMVDLLAGLNRPLESLAWESIAIRFRQSSGQLNEQQAEAAYADLARRRSEVVQNKSFELDPEFVLLGIDPNSIESDSPDE
ncbi:MAG: hypothetical protein AAGI63_10810 [Planctomycetota bacterium]